MTWFTFFGIGIPINRLICYYYWEDNPNQDDMKYEFLSFSPPEKPFYESLISGEGEVFFGGE